MSYPDINDLSTAYTLCQCGSVCSHHCTVCQSPTWREQGCVRRQFEMAPVAQVMANMPIARPAGLVREETNPQLPPDPDKVEEVIDWCEENDIPLQPWQAQALRALLNHDGKPAVFRGR
jgi:hypothetical protein